MDNNEELDQKEQREKALFGFDRMDTKLKLNNPIWANCTRAAFHLGMDECERMKLVAMNLVLQNGTLLDAQIQLAALNSALQSENETLKIQLSLQ
jgi:hypothetical protein